MKCSLNHSRFLLVSVLLNACSPSNSPQVTTERNHKENGCIAAYQELQSLRQTLSDVTQQSDTLPSEDFFMARCTTWSDETIRCLALQYQLEHLKECEQAWSTLSKQDRKALWKTPNLSVKP